MLDNPVVALLGAIIVIAISVTALAAGGSNALEICYNRVADTCSHAAQPIPCTQNEINTCDKAYTTTLIPKPANKRAKPNREIVLQSDQ